MGENANQGWNFNVTQVFCGSAGGDGRLFRGGARDTRLFR